MQNTQPQKFGRRSSVWWMWSLNGIPQTSTLVALWKSCLDGKFEWFSKILLLELTGEVFYNSVGFRLHPLYGLSCMNCQFYAQKLTDVWLLSARIIIYLWSCHHSPSSWSFIKILLDKIALLPNFTFSFDKLLLTIKTFEQMLCELDQENLLMKISKITAEWEMLEIYCFTKRL